ARLYDTAPDSVAGRLFRRDGNDYSDWFYVHIDSYFDRRTGFSFAVNPRGVRKDFLIFDDSQEDLSWDPVWSAAARMDDEGWTVEMRIPLSQLRYSESDGPQTWGINFQRRIARHGEIAFWSPLPGDLSRYVSGFGTLAGIQNLSRPIRLEAQPYAVSRLHRPPGGPEGDPFYEENDLFASAGADLKYGLTADLTLTATVNPDFGQVEVDPAVVNLSAFETFFEERRPFFVEGAEIFSFGRTRTFNNYGFTQYFYSRRIGRQPQRRLSGFDFVDAPEATTILTAAKVSGKTPGGWSLGALDAVTPVEKARFATAEGVRGREPVEPFTNYFVGRVRKDFSAGRTVLGGLVTAVNRNLEDPAFDPLLHQNAYVGGVDFTHAWGGRRWTVSGFGAGSLVRGDAEALLRTQRASARYYQRPDAGYLSVDPERTALSGYVGEVSLAKTGGEHWRGSLTYKETSPGLETNDLGFLSLTDRRAFSTFIQYEERTPERRFRNYNVFAFSNHAWNYGGDNVFTAYVLAARATFTNFWEVFGNVRYQPTVMNDRLTRGGPVAAFPASWSTFVAVESDDRKPFSAEFGVFARRDVEREYDTEFSLELNIRPTSALQIELEPEITFERDTDQFVTSIADALATATFGRRYVFADVTSTSLSLETRVGWTFTSNLSLQLFLQPLVVASDFDDYKEFLAPRTFDFAVYGEDVGTLTPDPETGRLIVDPDGDGLAGSFAVGGRFGQDDFTFRSLRGNLVLRWEYRPGSTLFLVWQHARSNVGGEDALRLGRDLDDLFGAPADNVFLVKLTYWLGR
ncbi:MAG: DUF5916 domain-containing protein, partial [Rhodothermales bacterium]|nr:DUF5916 domain-containing protein [Rhodothermales bacterium]